DDHDVVRRVGEERGVLRAVDDDEGVDRAAARERRPLAALGEAVRAEDARRPAELPAREAALRAQLALAASLPVRRAVFGDGGQRLLDDEHHEAPVARRAPGRGAASTVRRKSATSALNSTGRSSIGRWPQRSSTLKRACATSRARRRLVETERRRSSRPQTTSVRCVKPGRGGPPAAHAPATERAPAPAQPGEAPPRGPTDDPDAPPREAR